MEIKVVCDCGTKYAFEVEPVDGHMPQPVKCPACGANGTAQANAAIREGLGIAAPAPAPIPVPAPVVTPPVHAMPTAPTTPVAKPPPVRLSVQRPEPAPSHAQPAHASGQGYPGAVSIGGIQGAGGGGGESEGSVWAARSKKLLHLAWKGALILLCGLVMLAGFGGKKGKRFRLLAKVTSSVIKANASDEDEEEGPKNLWGQDIVLLLIKHTNETDVVETCTTFWQDTYKKKVSFTSTNEPDLGLSEDQIAIIPAKNGCVQVVGTLKWPKEDFEKLTQLLSQKLNTTAVETRDVDFSGAYVFGVFENGERKFRAEMEIKGKTLEDMQESVTVEGKDWARQHGFKPGKEGWNEFHLGDGDRITQRLGFNLGEQTNDQWLILTEITNRPTAKPAVARQTSARQPAKAK